MKQRLLKFLLLAFSSIFLINCKKKETPAQQPVTQDPYTYNNELQSSKDISMATFAISDIDMMCAFTGEHIIFNNFYLPNFVEDPGATTSMLLDTNKKVLDLEFYDTRCIDGKTRDGSISFYYAYDPNTNPNARPDAKFYHNFGFVARIDFVDYIVNGWRIDLYDHSAPAYISNKLTSATFDPGKTNLTWEISGKFKLTNLADTSRNIIWDGKIIKTLTNTNDPAVFPIAPYTRINWKAAKVNYSGSASGVTGRTVPFTFDIKTFDHLTRDFTCSFTPVNRMGVTQSHPFISGISTFTTSNYHPRSINYGSTQDCDNKGTISFHGESYNVDFD